MEYNCRLRRPQKKELPAICHSHTMANEEGVFIISILLYIDLGRAIRLKCGKEGM